MILLFRYGDGNFGLELDGMGFNEFSLPGNTAPPCHNFSNENLWFSMNSIQGGALAFNIVPNNPAADYSFAI